MAPAVLNAGAAGEGETRSGDSFAMGKSRIFGTRAARILIERFVPEASRTWAVSRYSAGRGETQAAVDQAQTMAMLSPQQVVFLEDAEAIEKLGEKNRDEAVAQLTAYLENPAPFTVLVVEATGLDQRMKLGKLLAEKTLVVECGLGEKRGRRGWRRRRHWRSRWRKKRAWSSRRARRRIWRNLWRRI